MTASRPPDLDQIIANLENGPTILRNLLAQIPREILKEKRIPGKWSIHVHACHIVDVQPMLMARLERFQNESHPVFVPYIPDGESGEAPLLAMNLEDQLSRFPALRAQLVGMIKDAPDEVWSKQASHPEYTLYTANLMVRHIMMHDYLHMYRMEELWVTRPEYLRK